MSSVDVAVVGAGAIGASCAYHLARVGLRVVVIEAAAGPAQGSTGRSFASVRAQWADRLNIELSRRSIATFAGFRSEHGIDIGYRPTGYLFLVPASDWPDHLRAVDLQRELGVRVDTLTPVQAGAHTPLDTNGLGGASWGPDDGVVDPHLLTSAFLTLARAHGAQARFRARVQLVERSGTDWLLHAGGGEPIVAAHVVNATGGWAGELARLAGLDVPVAHSRRNVYASARGALAALELAPAVDPTAPIPGVRGPRTDADRDARPQLPMTIDLGTGVFLRSEGDRLIFGAARPGEPDGYRTDVDRAWMEQVLALAVPRFPWLAELPLDPTACWAGTYENTPDHVGILGPHPDAPGWIDACGFSGHGIMQCPEVGRLVAEQIATGSITSVDASGLRLERFAHSDGPSLGMVL